MIEAGTNRSFVVPCSNAFLFCFPAAECRLLVVLPLDGTYKVLENHGECCVGESGE